MTILADTRPAFTDGLTLGGEDLTLLLEYLRTADRRLRLGYRTEGIVAGLELLPQTDVLGQTGWVLTPGLAVDGYGRLILSLNSVAIDAADLAGQPAGPIPVWIGYSEEPRRGFRMGFQVCDEDAFARVDEGFDLHFGRLPSLDQRRDEVDVDGQLFIDARALGEPGAPVRCDGSIGHQAFPHAEEQRLWLIPLGSVGWNGAQLVALDPELEQPQRARADRRHSGMVAETLYASEGMIRMARRDARAPVPGETVDQVCAERAPRASDFVEDPLDPGSFVPEDLVWVEGHLRALGDLRLWGTDLSFRNADGSETSSSNQEVPLTLARGPGDGLTVDTQDIELTLGLESQSDVANRLLIGRRADDGTHMPVAALTGLGRLGLGTDDPGRYLPAANALVIEGDAEAGQTIQSSAAGAIHFAQGDAISVQTRGRILYDHSASSFSWRTGDEDRMWLDGAGRLGIGLDDPSAASSFADDLVVFREGSAGISVICGEDAADAQDSGWSGRLVFGRGLDGGSAETGVISYAHGNDRMQLSTASIVRMTLDSQGEVGIGTTTPRTRLHVSGGTPLDNLGRDAGTIAVGRTGDTHLKIGETGLQALRGSNQSDQLQLQPLGGGLRVHGLEDASARAVITASGQMGLGTETPSARMEVRGRVRLGGAGLQHALAGQSGDLVLRGTVNAGGSLAQSGGGIASAIRTATGRYAVTFDTPFSAPPTVTVTPHDEAEAGDNIATISNVTASGFNVRIVDMSLFLTQGADGDGAPATADEDSPFSFIAMGPSALLDG